MPQQRVLQVKFPFLNPQKICSHESTLQDELIEFLCKKAQSSQPIDQETTEKYDRHSSPPLNSLDDPYKFDSARLWQNDRREDQSRNSDDDRSKGMNSECVLKMTVE